MEDQYQFKVYDDASTMALEATKFFIDVCKKNIQEYGRCTVCLSGGSTPKKMFELLAQEHYKAQVEWDKLFVFWGDERTVPQESPDSNSGAAIRLLFEQVDIPSENIFPIQGALPPAEAAKDYEDKIKKFFGEDDIVFDLCFLGMGDDGHTASLFPYTDIIYEKEALVKEVFVEKLDTNRISLTPKIINDADQICFLIGGQNKAAVLAEVLDGNFNPEKLPSQLIIKERNDITFFLDEAAAKELNWE